MAYTISLAAGLIMLVISILKCRESLKFLKQTDRAEGVVTEIKKFRGESDTYKPLFKFTTVDGQEVIYHHNFSSSPSLWSVGEKGIIAYNPFNPEKAKLLSYWGIFSWSIGLMCAALPLIVIGGGYHLAQLVLK
jgi:hypothetical protein